MKKILLLSLPFAILSISTLAQNTKEKNKEVKSNGLTNSALAKEPKEQDKEVKKDTTEWEKKVIAELKLTDSQKEKLDSLDKEFNKKNEALKQSETINKKEVDIKLETVNIIDDDKKEAAGIGTNASTNQTNDLAKRGDNEKAEILKQNSGMNKEEVDKQMMILKKERELAFMELLTAEQLTKYKELVEKKNKESQAQSSPKPVPKKAIPQ